MTQKDFKDFLDTAWQWNEDEEGLLLFVDIHYDGQVITCTTDAFLDFNEEWHYETEEEYNSRTRIGYNDGSDLFIAELRKVSALRIYEEKQNN